jgi:hypothetical protein
MSFIYRKIDDTYVVWFAPANRYLQLQEPAFRVVEQWGSGVSVEQIVGNCRKEYGLKISEARSFVNEVIAALAALISNSEAKGIPHQLKEGIEYPTEFFSTKKYLINGKSFLFRYGHPDLAEMFHPGFAYLESDGQPDKYDHCFDLFFAEGRTIVQIDHKTAWECPENEPERLSGLLYLQWLNLINKTTDDFWMGAVHASAVSSVNGAILFTAPSGSGKSTIAALLMHEGLQVLSDDFTPVSLNDPKVYPFPEGISVKNRSLSLLKSYFPSLEKMSDEYYEDFLPIISNNFLTKPLPVRAIVFLYYDATVDFKLEKLQNLSAMDDFLKQLWLPPLPDVASKFLDWFFQIPCFTLRYSDNQKAVNGIKKLFNNG